MFSKKDGNSMKGKEHRGMKAKVESFKILSKSLARMESKLC